MPSTSCLCLPSSYSLGKPSITTCINTCIRVAESDWRENLTIMAGLAVILSMEPF